MKKTLLKITMVFIMIIQIVACSKSETTTMPVSTVSTKIVSDLIADTVLGLNSIGMPYSAGKYTFYSLENNAIVSNTDSASAKWDLAFMSTRILTNGGTSGPALGGAFIYYGLFDELKTIPVDSVFKTLHDKSLKLRIVADEDHFHLVEQMPNSYIISDFDRLPLRYRPDVLKKFKNENLFPVRYFERNNSWQTTDKTDILNYRTI